MRFIETVYEKLRSKPRRIVFPEGNEPRVTAAAVEYVERGFGAVLLVGSRDAIEQAAKEASVSLEKIQTIDPAHATEMPDFCRRLELFNHYRHISEPEARQILINPSYFGTMLLLAGQADGLVAGAMSTSGGILRPLFQMIRPRPGVQSISSAMVVQVPNCTLGEDGVFIFADCGVIPRPSIDQLASIAVEAARLGRLLSSQPPRVAMLSYSTKGSALTEDTERIVEATELARQRLREQNIEAEIDGELQADAALVPEVAKIKTPNSAVAGRANALIFPDLNSGNISLKLVQRLASAEAYGQILLGLAKPAADLSRGASVAEILGTAALVSLQAGD
jgi:phosphate acetyltransferase